VKYLLDTCVISELIKPEPNNDVQLWFSKIPSASLFLSVITIGEIKKGIVKLPISKKKMQLNLWLTTLIQEYGDRIIPIDLSISETWGQIQGEAEKNGTPISTLDAFIASTALVHKLIVVTRNESDFLPTNVPILNLWS
jgi:toxin FitB